jgi:hypothetical protein
MEDVPVNFGNNMLFSHSDATPHFLHEMCNRLNNYFLDTQIILLVLMFWITLSADLRPFNFFLWECNTENVYAVEVQDCDNLINCILVTVTDICGQHR